MRFYFVWINILIIKFLNDLLELCQYYWLMYEFDKELIK